MLVWYKDRMVCVGFWCVCLVFGYWWEEFDFVVVVEDCVDFGIFVVDCY